MTNKDVRNYILDNYKENELIFASLLFNEYFYELINENTFYKIIERMCKKEELVRIAKGLYVIPKLGKYGIIPISNKEIVEEYTNNNTGMIIGYNLYNYLNLTTQVSKNIEVLSANMINCLKQIKDVTIHNLSIEFSKDIKKIIENLEVLQNYKFIEDINETVFKKYTEVIATSYKEKEFDAIQKVRKYKKSTLSFYKNILDYYKVENSVSKYLSYLSKYNHPKMEELYEASQK